MQPTAIGLADSGTNIAVQDSHAAWGLIFGEAVAPTSIPAFSHLALAVLATRMGLIGLRNRRRFPS